MTGDDGQTSWALEHIHLRWVAGWGGGGEGVKNFGFRLKEKTKIKNSGRTFPGTTADPSSTSDRVVRPRHRVTVVVVVVVVIVSISSRMTADGGGHGPHGTYHARDVRAASSAVAARVWDPRLAGHPSAGARAAAAGTLVFIIQSDSNTRQNVTLR